MRGKLHFSREQLCIPYALFLICFVAAPLVVIISYAFTNGEGHFTMENLTGFFTSSNTIGTLAYSFAIAVVTTCVCLLLAYPIAYILARSELKNRPVILLMFIMPMWINFTLRITALKEILTILEGNLSYHPFLNTIIGMTYDFLPFMILPIYTSLLKLDTSLLEAASDLGADSLHVFLKVTLPLSVPGIISGIVMVFLPSMTNYVVLDMLYNSTYIMGSLIGAYFSAYDWHNGSMIALVLLVIILVFTLFTDRYSDDEDSNREVQLNDKKSM
jgi:spermidine/putrescine transport system permease protein